MCNKLEIITSECNNFTSIYIKIAVIILVSYLTNVRRVRGENQKVLIKEEDIKEDEMCILEPC